MVPTSSVVVVTTNGNATVYAAFQAEPQPSPRLYPSLARSPGRLESWRLCDDLGSSWLHQNVGICVCAGPDTLRALIQIRLTIVYASHELLRMWRHALINAHTLESTHCDSPLRRRPDCVHHLGTWHITATHPWAHSLRTTPRLAHRMTAPTCHCYPAH